MPECARDIGDAVFSQDVEGETACPCHDAGVVADAAFILVAGDVADIVVAVFYAPMASDGIAPRGWSETGSGGEVVGDLTALPP